MAALFVLVGSLFLSSAVSANSLPDQLNLLSYIWRPYQYDENGTIGGPVGRVAKCAIDKLGVPYTLRIVPITRAEQFVRVGRADGWFVARETEKRNSFAVPTNEFVGHVRVGLVVKKNAKFDLSDPTVIQSMQLGTVKGTGSADKLAKLVPAFEEAASETRLIDYLKTEKIDGAYYSLTPMLHEANYIGLDVRHKVFEETVNYFYFNKDFVEKYPQLIPSMDPLIAECRHDAE